MKSGVVSRESGVGSQESKISRKRKTIYFLLLTSYFLLLTSGVSYAAVTVNVADTSAVEGEMIYLKDIAEIKGDRTDMVDKLKNIVIGFSPPLGESQIVTEDFLRLCIRRSRIPLEDIEMNSPPQISISRKYYEITSEQLRGIVKEFIEKKLVPERFNPGMEASGGKVIIENVNFNGRIFLPSPDFNYEVNASNSVPSADHIFLQIIFKANGKIQKSVNVTVDLSVLVPSVVALRNIKRGETISEGDIQIEERKMSRDTFQLITDIKDAVGKQAKTDIKNGEVITKNSIEVLPIVNQGDVVNIVAESVMFKVTVKGVVREKGGKGELVKVLNVSSNKIIHAKIIDSNTLRVEF